MKKHSAAHLIPLSLQSLQDEMVSLSLQSVHMKTMTCLLPTASMKPLSVNQLLWALVLDVAVLRLEVHQNLQLGQETFLLPSCSTVPLHHAGFVLLDKTRQVRRRSSCSAKVGVKTSTCAGSVFTIAKKP